MTLRLIFLLASLWSLIPAASAGTQSIATQPNSSYSPTSPVGLGSLIDELPGSTGYAFVVEGENHFKQRRGAYGLTQYGEAESRLELGEGTGISLGAISGITLVGIHPGQSVALHLGIEPFSGQITLNSNSSRESYYEYLPMVSLGPQLAVASCRVLALARAGGGAGNLDQPGLLPAFSPGWGVGSYVDCERSDLSFNATRLYRDGQIVDLDTADALLAFNGGKVRLGLRGERNAEPDRVERRVLLLLRSRLSF